MGIFVATISVLLLNAYAALLVVLRARVYGVVLYRPMLVNILLSFVPVLGAVLGVVGLLGIPWLQAELSIGVHTITVLLWIYLVVGTALWLLFFPNAIYLITELNFSHRGEDDPVPLWYDIVQTLTLTLSGIANAVLSLAVVQTEFVVVLLDPAASDGIPGIGWLFAGIVIVLGAVGVYLGRYLRFNSWDVRHPASMVRKLVTHLRTRGKALEAGGFILTHSVLVGLVYVPVYTLAYAGLIGR